MRSLLVYIFFSVALWYLAKAVMRHYLAPPNNSGSGRNGPDPNSPPSQEHGNYESAREARFRDVE